MVPQPAVGRRLLKFPDGSEIGVMGLDEIMAVFFGENRKPTYETADEIIQQLEEKKNFIPSSESVRKEYAYVLLRMYREYIKDRSD